MKALLLIPNFVIDLSSRHALFVIECQCICVSLHSLTSNLFVREQSLNFVESTENVEGLPKDAEDDQPRPYLFYDDDCNVELSAVSKEDGGQAGNSEEAAEEYENQAGDEEVDMHSIKTELRRQRRHTLAACVREALKGAIWYKHGSLAERTHASITEFGSIHLKHKSSTRRKSERDC